MARTRMGYERIKNMHAAGHHDRCPFGCSPDNMAPNEGLEFEAGRIEASRALAAQLGNKDPRVSVAKAAQRYLDTAPDLPSAILMKIGGLAAMIDDLSATVPDQLDNLKVRIGRRLIADAKKGVYHN